MYDKTVAFLAKAAILIPQIFPDSAAVKSHLITKCRDAEYDKQVTLAKSSFGPNILCKKCGNPWSCVEKIRIGKSRKFKHQQHLLKSQARPESKLNSIQKKIQKFQSKKLMRICKFCKNIAFIGPLSRKILRTKTNVPFATTPKKLIIPNTPQTKPKSKKKKKDAFAGLNKIIVQQSRTPKSLKGKLPQVLSETPKGIPKQNVNKLARALNKESSGSGSSIMKLLK